MIFIEYRAQYREFKGFSNGVTFSPSLNALRDIMAVYKIVNRYVIEGFDGIMWHQIEKTKDYDPN
jgi:hypothetical protein